MPRKAKPPTVPDNMHVDAKDIVANVFPEGVPKELDGTVNTNAEISIKQVQEIGALDEDSAASNKSTARVVQKKQQGATNVAWPTSDPMEHFDLLRMAWAGKSFAINITQVEPVMMNYRPVMTSQFKTRGEVYDYISKYVHKQSEARKYEIKYCDTLGQVRARGFLYMPDTRDQQENEMSRQNPFPFPPPYGYPGYPPAYGAQGYPPPPGFTPPGYPPTGYGAPPPAPPQAAAPPPPPPPPPPPQAPSPAQMYAPEPSPQGYGFPQAGYGAPGVYEAMQASQNAAIENRRTQDTIQQVLLQNAQLLGQIEEMRRQQMQAPPPPIYMPPPPAAPAQPAQSAGAGNVPPGPSYAAGVAGPPGYPPGYPAAPPAWNAPQAPPGWNTPPPPPGWGPYPQQGAAYPPGYPQPGYWPPPQAPYPNAAQGQPPPPAPPNGPAAAAQEAVNTISSLVHAVQAVQRIPGFGGGRGPFAQQEDLGEESPMDAGPQAPEMPWTMMPIVPGDRPITMAVDKNGQTNWAVSALASAPGILESAKGLVNSIAELQRGQQQIVHQQSQILRTQGGMPQHQALPQQVQHEPPPPEPSAAPSLAEMAAAAQGVNGIS